MSKLTEEQVVAILAVSACDICGAQPGEHCEPGCPSLASDEYPR